MNPASSPAPAGAKHQIAFNLALLGIGAALIALGLAYGIDALKNRQAAPKVTQNANLSVEKIVAGTRLNVPVDWIRFENQKTSDFAERLDLSLPVQFSGDPAPKMIEASVLPRSKVRPSSQLLDAVYLHVFKAGQKDGPVGLIGKPLIDRDGYEGETVWYDPISPNPFVAKCAAPVGEAKTGNCMRTIALNTTTALVISFDATLLQKWRQFDAAIQIPLNQIGLSGQSKN